MKTSPFSWLVRAVALPVAALGFWLAGCSLVPAPTADPTRYFVLNDPEPGANEVPLVTEGVVVAVARVQVATYLDRKPMVVRAAGNEVIYYDYDLWAEPPAAGIRRVVAAKLVDVPGIVQVVLDVSSAPAADDLRVGLNVSRFEGVVKKDGTGYAHLMAMIEVSRGGAVVARKAFASPEISWDGKDMGALAAALSEAAAALGDAVALAVAE